VNAGTVLRHTLSTDSSPEGITGNGDVLPSLSQETC
jgi:hypothetical protein